MCAWKYQCYGTAADPIHKSDLNGIVGDYGCPKQFRYEKDERAAGVERENTGRSVNGKAALGTAAHETIARALKNPDARARVLAGPGTFSTVDVTKVFTQEVEREVNGRQVEWYDKSPADLFVDRVAMITGLLNDLHRHVASIELCEGGFIAKLGEYWLCGHIDLLYRPKSNPTGLALGDWKTGASKPDQIELDHGWEAGVYSTAMRNGVFLPRECIESQLYPEGWLSTCRGVTCGHPSRYIAERNAMEGALIAYAQSVEECGALPDTTGTQAFSTFPELIHHVHLADYVPYKKAGKREIKRAEDLAFFGYDTPTDHKYVAGDRRGPAWLPVRLTEHDMPRLESRLRAVVGMIRMGRFIDQVGEKCKRCHFREPCLNSGYEVRGDERKQLELSMRGLELEDDGLGGSAA